MPKSITLILDPEQHARRRKKRRKRKVDYTELLQPPVVAAQQCPHTKRSLDKRNCSQCLNVKPSVVSKPKTVSWWVDEDDLDLGDLDLDVTIDIDSIVPDDEV